MNSARCNARQTIEQRTLVSNLEGLRHRAVATVFAGEGDAAPRNMSGAIDGSLTARSQFFLLHALTPPLEGESG